MLRTGQGVSGRIWTYHLNSEPPPWPRTPGGHRGKNMQVAPSCCGLSHAGAVKPRPATLPGRGPSQALHPHASSVTWEPILSLSPLPLSPALSPLSHRDYSPTVPLPSTLSPSGMPSTTFSGTSWTPPSALSLSSLSFGSKGSSQRQHSHKLLGKASSISQPQCPCLQKATKGITLHAFAWAGSYSQRGASHLAIRGLTCQEEAQTSPPSSPSQPSPQVGVVPPSLPGIPNM